CETNAVRAPPAGVTKQSHSCAESRLYTLSPDGMPLVCSLDSESVNVPSGPLVTAGVNVASRLPSRSRTCASMSAPVMSTGVVTPASVTVAVSDQLRASPCFARSGRRGALKPSKPAMRSPFEFALVPLIRDDHELLDRLGNRY